MSDTEVLSQEKIWEASKYFYGAFGAVPNSFSSTIRTLMSDHQRHSCEYSTAGRFLAQRLLRSASVRVPLHYALLSYIPDRAPAVQDPQPNDYFAVLGPYDMACFLATIYSFRKLRKRCDAQEFGVLAKLIQEATDIGCLIGVSMPKIGLGNGLLGGAFCLMMLCPFMLQNIKAYKEYKRKTKPKGQRYNLALELEQFSCTHAHICSWILPTLGLGVSVATAVTEGFLAEMGPAPDPKNESYKFYITMLWIEELLRTGAPPEITHKGGFYPVKAEMDKLLAAVAEIRESGSKYSWFDKCKDDSTATGAAETEESVESDEDIPDEIRKEMES